ncbi:PIN domain-containing protein [Skermanella mucosa]|uniref:PIN domain-containing protein n=1 Tax=Skermanella mucosa TaxID=1789672 RepID=UPI00192BE61C|nr:PIN domain-containing protein [Skermanella mucosa]UEM22196.1 PIN domain-containing protein [Skermanella mucosa]
MTHVESTAPAQDRLILDTNVFVAAGFNPGSNAAAVVEAVREGRYRLAWAEATRRETETVVRRIPGLDWSRLAGLFAASGEHRGPLDVSSFSRVEDPGDRKFAALAWATGAALITSDAHLLSCRDELPVTVLTPREFVGGSTT